MTSFAGSRCSLLALCIFWVRTCFSTVSFHKTTKYLGTRAGDPDRADALLTMDTEVFSATFYLIKHFYLPWVRNYLRTTAALYLT